VRPADNFNLLNVEDMAKAMVREAKKQVEELSRKQALLEEEYRRRREELAEEYGKRREALEKELEEQRERAREEIDALRKEVEEKVRKEAFEEGYQEGLLRGREEGLEKGYAEGERKALAETRERFGEELESVVRSLERLLSEVRARRDSLFRDAEREVLRLAVSVAEKIVKHEIRIRPDVVMGNLRKALEIIAQRTGAVLEINPDDLSYVEKHAPGVLKIFREGGTIEIAANSHVDRGGCLVRSAGGGADLRIQTQLELIEQALLGVETKVEEVESEEVSEGTRVVDLA